MKARFVLALAICGAQNVGAQSPNVHEQLEMAERDFQKATLERGVEGWSSFFADSGAQLQNTSRIIRGHSAIWELMGEFLASKTEKLIWWPVSSEVSAGGDMAYTFGGSGVVAADSTGKLTMNGRGTYLTVWRRQADGRWLVTADMGGQASPRALERAGDSASSKDIASIEQVRSWAITTKDTAAVEKIYSSDFLAISAKGALVDRRTILSSLLQINKWQRFRSDIVAVSVAGRTGIATGILYTFSDDMGETRTSFLHVYVHRNGHWVLVRGIAGAMKK